MRWLVGFWGFRLFVVFEFIRFVPYLLLLPSQSLTQTQPIASHRVAPFQFHANPSHPVVNRLILHATSDIISPSIHPHTRSHLPICLIQNHHLYPHFSLSQLQTHFFRARSDQIRSNQTLNQLSISKARRGPLLGEFTSTTPLRPSPHNRSLTTKKKTPLHHPLTTARKGKKKRRKRLDN